MVARVRRLRASAPLSYYDETSWLPFPASPPPPDTDVLGDALGVVRTVSLAVSFLGLPAPVVGRTSPWRDWVLTYYFVLLLLFVFPIAADWNANGC